MNQVGAIDLNRPNQRRKDSAETGGSVNRPYLKIAACGLAFLFLTSCATTSHHQFAQPTNDWRVRSGQLLYQTATTSVIGDVLVRYSNAGDFELTFSKGPGVTLLTLRQDAQFVSAQGAIAERGWSGPIDQAPKQLQGWVGLRQAFLQAKDRKSIRSVAGGETFLFRF